MIRTFWFITFRSAKNRLVSRLKRLREPRYLVGFFAGLAYIWYMGLRRLFVANQFRHGLAGVQIPTGEFVTDCIALMVLVPMILAWALPDQAGGLVFSEAEIQFLFPAPLSRRQLLIYKVLRQQPPILISALMMSFFGFASSRFVGLWISFVAASIYFTAVSLARARLKLMGIGFLWRLVAVVAALVGVATLVIHAFGALQLGHAGTYADVMRALRAHPPSLALRALVFLPRFFAFAVAPTSLSQLAMGCAAMAIAAFVLLEIAAQLNVSFEEASIHAAQKKEGYVERVRAFRSGRRVMFGRIPPPFRLPAHPSPELAILWKNLIAALRISIAWMVIIGALFAILVGESLYGNQPAINASATTMALFMCGLFPLMASGVLTQDMRLDLQRIEILKSYPISGERLIAAEIAAPLTIMSLVELILLGGTTLLLQLPNGSTALQRMAKPEYAVIALLFAIPICAMQLLIRNAAAVLFPGWSMRSPDDPKGFVIMGQRLIFLASNLLILSAALIPSAIVVLIGWLISRSFSASFAVPFATLPAVALLAGEVWMGIKMLGAQFEKIDVTNEMGSAIV